MKKIVGLLAFCTLAASAQVLPEHVECRYERETQKKVNGRITSVQRETCIEEPEVVVNKFRVGDIVREAKLPPHPVIRNDFAYKQSRCRWFVETDTAQRDLVQYQGIACEVQPNVWRVIDKF